jgi:hypothetical protein
VFIRCEMQAQNQHQAQPERFVVSPGRTPLPLVAGA